jgi:chaperonin cofactor prefoldin
VTSRALPGKNISEIIKEDLIYKIVLTEHSDPDEFIDNQEKTVDRVLMILGANKKNAYSFSTSSASASGIAQFIKGSYDLASGQYRKAGLPGYSDGTKDHKQSLKASILLNDYSLDRLYKKFGSARIDKERDDLLAAAYNGGVGRVSSALKQFGDEWQKNHFTEVAQALKEVNNTKEEIDTLSRKKTDKIYTKTQKSRELRELRKKLTSLETKYKTLENARLRNETRIYLLKFKQILASLADNKAHIPGYCRL